MYETSPSPPRATEHLVTHSKEAQLVPPLQKIPISEVEEVGNVLCECRWHVYVTVQRLAIVTEQEGVRHALVTLTQTRLGTSCRFPRGSMCPLAPRFTLNLYSVIHLSACVRERGEHKT